MRPRRTASVSEVDRIGERGWVGQLKNFKGEGKLWKITNIGFSQLGGMYLELKKPSQKKIACDRFAAMDMLHTVINSIYML